MEQGDGAGSWSDADTVAEVNDSISEAALVQELERQSNVIRQCALSATDDNRTEQQVAFVDQACCYRLAGELWTADGDVAGRGLFEHCARHMMDWPKATASAISYARPVGGEQDR